MSPFLANLPQKVDFELLSFKIMVTEKFGKDYDLEDLTAWGVMDYNRYNTTQLLVVVKKFLEQTSY